MKKQWISLAPHLLDWQGHDFHYHQSLQEVATYLNMDFQAYIAKNSSLPEKTNWHRWFRQGFMHKCLDFYRILKKKSSLFFIESFSGKDLLQLCLAVTFCKKKSSSLCLLFRYGLDFFCLKGKLHHILVKYLSLQWKERLIFFTDSVLVQKEYQKKWKIKLHLLPIPHTKHSQAIKNTVKNSHIIAWWPGPPRASKGWKEIRNLSGRSSYFQIKAARSANIPNITPLPDRLDTKRYWQEMQSSDCILLPYDASGYKSNTSGIFIEAICSGKMPFVKDGSWLAYELKRFGLTELIIDWNGEDTIENIKQTLENHLVRDKVLHMRKNYLDFHNQSTFCKYFQRAFDVK